jgi:hypothetical protein
MLFCTSHNISMFPGEIKLEATISDILKISFAIIFDQI